MANYQVTPSGNPKFEPSVAVHLLSPNIIIATSVNFTTGSPLAGPLQVCRWRCELDKYALAAPCWIYRCRSAFCRVRLPESVYYHRAYFPLKRVIWIGYHIQIDG